MFKIFWDKKDIISVTDVIKSGTSWAAGPKLKEFEIAIADYTGAKYALVFNSGTSALHALMLVYGFGPGDEIIVPSFSFIATANAPLFVGARPVFAEIEETTFGLDLKDIEQKITAKTKAIIPIHYGGMSCKIDEIKKIAKKHNLILIEDVAESFGGEINNKKTGTFGDAAALSFCQNKIITTGEGGAVLTDSREIYEKLKMVRSHGRLEKENYFSSARYADYMALGYNFRMSDMSAALGLSQLKKIKKIIQKRRKNAHYLNKKLSELDEIIIPVAPKNYFNVFQMYTIRVKAGKKTRDALKNYLNNKGIASKVYFDPIHLTSFYKNNFGYKKGDLPLTERISGQVLTLPMYPELTKREIDHVVKNIKYFFKR